MTSLQVEQANFSFMSARLLRIQDWEKLAREAKFQPEIMAALCSISLRTLERFFASTFNTTPTSWARRLRCRIAQQLIMQGWKNTAVVNELSFGNESHLCHEFQIFYGVSPQTFAPTYRGNGRPLASKVRFLTILSPLDKNVALRQCRSLARPLSAAKVQSEPPEKKRNSLPNTAFL